MKLSERIEAFGELGTRLHTIEDPARAALFRQATDRNSWFTPEHCQLAFDGILKFLQRDALTAWTKPYPIDALPARNVGVVMAGNIPMVGFHDLLSVLISGHRITAKLSSQDPVLIPFLVDQLIRIEPRFQEFISFGERMNDVDAVIATGGDNTARYFEYYFRQKPHIIRKNRSSLAILHGKESTSDLTALGKDVFSYFGLGCRNVSKLLVPEGYDLTRVLHAWEYYQELVIHHHKYVNNYDYNKSILLVNRVPFLDNGSVLLREDEALVSPISVVYFERWKSEEEIRQRIESWKEKIQCIVTSDGWWTGSVRFGKAQEPELTDYADGADTLAFLTSLR